MYGSILTKSDLEALEEIVSHNKVYLMSDEVYEHIVFDGMKHLSLASNDALWERSFVVSSFGKTFHATGWKVGFCAAPEELTNEVPLLYLFPINEKQFFERIFYQFRAYNTMILLILKLLESKTSGLLEWQLHSRWKI